MNDNDKNKTKKNNSMFRSDKNNVGTYMYNCKCKASKQGQA